MSALPSMHTFAERVRTTFAARGEQGGAFALELLDVQQVGASESHGSFSLMFRAPADVPPEQGSYRLEHQSLSAMELFLVPVKRDATGVFFEAVFNTLPVRS